MPTVPKIIADFTTQLSVAIAVGATTGTLYSNLDDDGVSLPTGTYYFTIDGSNSNKEHIVCTNTAGALTAIKTVSRQGVETSGAARAHRVGASVVMTDFNTYKAYMDALALAGAADASQSTKGVVKLSAASAGDPIAVAIEDVRLPTADPTTLFAPLGGAPGIISPYAGRTAPSGYLLCDGSAVSRTTYAALKAVIAPAQTFTVTIASPGVFTASAHGLLTGDRIHITTSASGLPSGLAVNTDYWVSKKDANSFWLFDTQANAAADAGVGSGTGIIVTTGSQSGTHTLHAANYGKGDGSTTFNVPDLRGKSPFGYKSDNVKFNVINLPNTYAGEETHVLTIPELAAHAHNPLTHLQGDSGGTPSGVFAIASGGQNAGGYYHDYTNRNVNTPNTGSDTAHNNLPPYVVTNFIIKT